MIQRGTILERMICSWQPRAFDATPAHVTNAGMEVPTNGDTGERGSPVLHLPGFTGSAGRAPSIKPHAPGVPGRPRSDCEVLLVPAASLMLPRLFRLVPPPLLLGKPVV